MAKGKSSGSKYISQGKHSNVSRATLSGIAKDRSDSERFMNKFNAYLNGKNPWFTIANPNKAQKDKPFIRVRAEDLYGKLKERKGYMVSGS